MLATSSRAARLPPLLGAALRPLPLAPLQPVLALLLRAVVRQHPRIFDRLGEHARCRFGLDPTDLPFALILAPHAGNPRIRAVRALPACGLDARISGPILGLIDLAEGRVDGDALFFARTLVVEGDMAAVVALRNAIDGAGIDLAGDLAAALGPLGSAAAQALRAGLALIRRAAGGTAWS
jgi:predicted lipid carrier protein YhbT